MGPLPLLFAALLSPPADGVEIVVTAPAPPAFDAPAVPDPVLARMRGGIFLDNGFNIAIGIDIQTRVDGLLLLHTVYASDGPNAGLNVYTDGVAGPRVAPGTVAVDVPESAGNAWVTVDRSPTGTTVQVNQPTNPTSVNLVAADPGQWLNANGQTRVTASVDKPVTTGPGTFSVEAQPQGNIVTLDTSMLQIRHLIGQATGVVVANTANDRTIDTVSSVNVDLRGISPALLSNLFMVDRLAFDAMTGR